MNNIEEALVRRDLEELEDVRNQLAKAQADAREEIAALKTEAEALYDVAFEVSRKHNDWHVDEMLKPLREALADFRAKHPK